MAVVDFRLVLGNSFLFPGCRLPLPPPFPVPTPPRVFGAPRFLRLPDTWDANEAHE
ncbi:uncharacterized protein CLUP02_12394 [Colletotrichum lupini]|uniref:Uncharacterized protein n=1 Tax=Colletotrichum lupini TaxID=145971 RepID=A0A9Q8T0H5_9PEZI|nr:uncharacterized protein CLUP02_12394 [Colletotrichum lupini]UQC86892.1 hypothetical protein CLUP02_12394 [Colletotrichum lupini]